MNMAVAVTASVASATVVPSAATARFECTEAPQTYQVPSGAHAIDVLLAGAVGGDRRDVQPGLGGTVAATLSVTPGETLAVLVGCRSGYNGGGLNPYWHNGGGASDIRRGAATVQDRLVVAGGGGGAGGLVGGTGGAGGFVGTDAPLAADSTTGTIVYGGRGGTATRGGSGGSVFAGARCNVERAAQGGSLGQGGEGAYPYDYFFSGTGGGGGGGYYGGGGGTATCNGGSGGGGGSSFGPAGAVFATGVNLGDGYVEVTPVVDPVVTTAATPASSDDCTGGTGLFEAFAEGVSARATVSQPDPQTLWVCARVEAATGGFGGKLVVTQPTGISGLPTTDGDYASCATAAGNIVPTQHPILSGTVGDPSDPATYLPYLLDAYSDGSSTWLCLRAGSVTRRVIVPPGSGVTPRAVTFVADPPGVPVLAAPAAPATPSGECQRPLAGTRYLDATVADTRVFLYSERPAEGATRLCVRADGAVGVGGALTVDVVGTDGLLPSVETSTTDMSPCTVQVFHNDSPVVAIRRSATGQVPASVCVTVGSGSLRVTVGTGTGGQPVDVTWQPDPGTPGLP